MLDRARQRRAALEARLSNSDLSDGHTTSLDTNHGLALINFSDGTIHRIISNIAILKVYHITSIL